MSVSANQLRAGYAFVERNLNLIKRYWSWEVVWLVYSTADCLAVSFIGLGMERLGGGAVMLVAGSFSFIGIGVMTSIMPLLFPERGEQMAHVLIALVLLVSGVYYPVDVLPVVLQKLSVISPATYVLDGARQALLDGLPTSQLWQFIWPTLVMALVLIPSGLWIFNQAERYAKRAGKLHRNG